MSNAILIADELESLTFPYAKHPHAAVVRTAATLLREGERRQAAYRRLLERLVDATSVGIQVVTIHTIADDARRLLESQP